MASAWSKKLLPAGLIAASLVWATLPPDEVAFDRACAPNGSAALSAALYGGVFWRGQLRAAVAERDRLLALPARLEQLKEEARAAAGIEARMSRLAESEEGPADPAVEQSRRIEKLVWLVRCQSVIESRLSR